MRPILRLGWARWATAAHKECATHKEPGCVVTGESVLSCPASHVSPPAWACGAAQSMGPSSGSWPSHGLPHPRHPAQNSLAQRLRQRLLPSYCWRTADAADKACCAAGGHLNPAVSLAFFLTARPHSQLPCWPGSGVQRDYSWPARVRPLQPGSAGPALLALLRQGWQQPAVCLPPHSTLQGAHAVQLDWRP